MFSLTRKAQRRYFRADVSEVFSDDVEPRREPQRDIVTYTPKAIEAFLTAAERYADPDRAVRVTRRKQGKVERFDQGADTTAPVVEWALLLLCTGLRRSEAANLRWTDCDLDKGVLRIHATKTLSIRYLPLVGDPAGDISPRFLELLRAWQRAAPDAEFILPANAADGSAAFPKGGWERVTRNARNVKQFGPQGLRRTFESSLAAIGFPDRLTAFWLGHSAQVAEKHYLAYSPGRLPGKTMEEVLALGPFIDRALRATKHQRPIRLMRRSS